MKIEHTSTFRRGGASTGVIYIGVIPIHHIIWVFYGNGAGSGKSGDSDNSIVSSSSLSYRVRTTNFTKEDILQRRVVCVKNKHGLGCSREHNIHHASATKGQLHTFGSEKHFSPKNLERESDSTKYTDIQSEYVGKLAKIKLLDTRIMAYNMRYPFLIPTLLY